MDFKLTYEQEAIQKAAQEFAKGEFDRDLALEHEKTHTFPYEIWRKACELGFVGIHYPEEYGGQGYGVLENALVTEAFCRQDSGLGMALSAADSSAEMILRHGTKEQKEKYLTAVAQGSALSSGAFTEPDHGSDITCLSTTAVKNGEEFILNGTKTFITNGPVSAFVIVLCQTDPDAKPTYRGQSAVIVDQGTQGFTASDIGEKMGNRMVPTGELSFNEVRVPKSSLLGQENRGFYQAMELFEEMRIEVAAQSLGIAEGAFDRALTHMKERKQFGRRLEEFQTIQHKLADMVIKIETARLVVYRAAWNLDQGIVDPKLTSVAKAYASRAAVEVADEAIQIHGGYGYMLEYEVERFYRDARLAGIYGGTNEIQKNIIANSLLKRFNRG
ncbi:MAG TPA: acyl-CoA dehydrogenase family protein [Syntrophorhabdaceae bacterium]|nr:acyl-CoA dehydrogenase family protein [Syntrophorhabdaceae bacterium]